MRGRNPEEVMADLGFGELQLVTSFSVSMSGEPRINRTPRSVSMQNLVQRCHCSVRAGQIMLHMHSGQLVSVDEKEGRLQCAVVF